VYVRTYPRKSKPGALFRRPRPRTVLVGRCDLLGRFVKVGAVLFLTRGGNQDDDGGVWIRF
jgi:hypothetical protein